MPRVKYSHGEHMAQIGKVTGLMEAMTKIQKDVIKEQKKLKILEQRQLLEQIKNAPKKV